MPPQNEELERELLALSITQAKRKRRGDTFFMAVAIISLGAGFLGFAALIAYLLHLL